MNQCPPEYKAGVLPTQQRYSVYTEIVTCPVTWFVKFDSSVLILGIYCLNTAFP
jgi:hypothetical protein